MTLAQAREKGWFGPAAIALFAGLPLVVGILTVGNLVHWVETGTATRDTLDRLAPLESRIRAQAGRAVPKPGDTASLFLDAGTGSLARAELQQRLVGLVERSGGRLIEVRGDEAPEATAQRSITLRLSLDITNEGLFDLLAAVETGVPLLTVETLNIRPVPSRTSGSDEPNPTLRVALAIRGYQREDKP